jgi:hypothetical protein
MILLWGLVLGFRFGGFRFRVWVGGFRFRVWVSEQNVGRGLVQGAVLMDACHVTCNRTRTLGLSFFFLTHVMSLVLVLAH